MSGGLIQLVAYGAQDVFLTGKPQRTFWKGKFARYSNFAIESIEQDILGAIGSNQEISVILKRNGDLVSAINFEITFKRGPSDPTDPLAYYSCEQLLDTIGVYIGGQKIMEFGHEWFRMHWELMLTYEQEIAYNNMVNWGNEEEGYTRTFHLPIPFWFNSLELGNSLPLIALQYHDVEIRIKLCDLNNIDGIDPTYIPKMRCFANYTFLDSAERVWFASNPHEYIIQQVQTNNFNITVDQTQRDYNLNLNFNHPCSFLMWCFTPGTAYHGQYTSLPGEQDAEILSVLDSATLYLNGVERFKTRRGSYFSNESTWTGFAGSYTSSGVCAYPFGINCSFAEPSGTCNFSRLDTATLRIRTKAAVVEDTSVAGNVDESMTTVGANVLNTVIVFAPNYNILNIRSGMAGLAYAN
jgi:hypothetical protein